LWAWWLFSLVGLVAVFPCELGGCFSLVGLVAAFPSNNTFFSHKT
jgi:hypothetical protein